MTRSTRESLDLLKDKKKLVGAEIGVQSGINAEWMLKNLDIKKLYLIDPYDLYPCNNAEHTIIGPFDIGKKQAKKLLKPYEDKIEWIYKFSWNALKDFKNKSLDFVYIDADHREEAVIQDMDYASKLKFGGMLCGHDWKFQSIKNGVGIWIDRNRLEFNCCQKIQYVKVVDKHVANSDWWIKIPVVEDRWSQKCSQCQNIYNFTTKDIKWLK